MTMNQLPEGRDIPSIKHPHVIDVPGDGGIAYIIFIGLCRI